MGWTKTSENSFLNECFSTRKVKTVCLLQKASLRIRSWPLACVLICGCTHALEIMLPDLKTGPLLLAYSLAYFELSENFSIKRQGSSEVGVEPAWGTRAWRDKSGKQVGFGKWVLWLTKNARNNCFKLLGLILGVAWLESNTERAFRGEWRKEQGMREETGGRASLYSLTDQVWFHDDKGRSWISKLKITVLLSSKVSWSDSPSLEYSHMAKE